MSYVSYVLVVTGPCMCTALSNRLAHISYTSAIRDPVEWWEEDGLLIHVGTVSLRCLALLAKGGRAVEVEVLHRSPDSSVHK